MSLRNFLTEQSACSGNRVAIMTAFAAPLIPGRRYGFRKQSSKNERQWMSKAIKQGKLKKPLVENLKTLTLWMKGKKAKLKIQQPSVASYSCVSQPVPLWYINSNTFLYAKIVHNKHKGPASLKIIWLHSILWDLSYLNLNCSIKVMQLINLLLLYL